MISHEYKCIFTHIPKTGGKSIKTLFGLPEFERDYKICDHEHKIEYAFGHRNLSEFENEGYFAEYFKFAFVRNPFDKIVSAYFYMENGGCNEVDRQFREKRLAQYAGHFTAFVEDLPTFLDSTHFRPQAAWLCDSRRNLLADFVGRYEALERDLSTVRDRLGLSFDEAPRLNASRHQSYRSYYDDSTRRRVAQAYGEDMELFSYRFD